MTHQHHLEKKKYREWVKAGLGLVYLREGLAPFCDDIAKQQHREILDNIKRTKNLSSVTCDQCTLDNLKPDHVKLGNRQCPLGQPNCSCWYSTGKRPCPNYVCGDIYDVIVKNHGSLPPKPNLKNTDTQQWCTDSWSIAKCFINAPGYENKTSAADIDCTGLLHLIVNNKSFHDHIQGDLNIFSKIIEYRNEIFHSSSMELEEQTANTYIQDMIAVLQDGKELCQRQDANNAVKKLQELMREDFIITTRNEADVVLAAVQSIENILKEKLENVPTGHEVADLDTSMEILYSRTDSVDTRVSNLEKDMASVKEDVKNLKSAQLSQHDQYNYIKKKLEFQEKLIKLYRESLLQVSAIPLQPERNICNFSEVYVRPLMTHVTKKRNGQKKETEIKSMADIFTKEGIALTSIYVLGDVGAGKSSFCKYLVYYWCLAYCEGQSVKDEFNGVNEMKKFDFLFYVSLRHCKDVASIKEMLEKQYKCEVLTQLSDKESEKIIIVLDGLDEWSPPKHVTLYQFQTEGLPERDNSKDFSIVTTSRPWKIVTLGITDREMQKRLTLKGFDRSSVDEMIYKSIPILNKSFDKNKHPWFCQVKLRNVPLESIKQVPLMLLQLICLWFDGKLEETSKCAIYTGMLELFFSLNDKKKTEFEHLQKLQKMSEGIQELPQYLIDRNIFRLNRYLINEVARLAYESPFKKTKEASLTFDSSIFEQLEISDEVKTSCLRLGILSEGRCLSLSASACQSTVLSFVHKSVQEYFAAVHIAIKFRARVGSSVDMENADLSHQCAQFFETYFFNCATLDEVLEQENVLVMLCGLEPRIATSVSKYIYDIVNRDARVLEYRRKLNPKRDITFGDDKYSNLINNIQQCILNSIEEVEACKTESQFNFYLGDIVYLSDQFSKFSGQQHIFHDSVRSFFTSVSYFDFPYDNLDDSDDNLDAEDGNLDDSDDNLDAEDGNLDAEDTEDTNESMLEYMLKCRQLETIYMHGDDTCTNNYNLIENTFTVIDLNVSILKSLSVNFHNFRSRYFSLECSTIHRRFPNMKNLVALQLADITVTHDYLISLCTFLSETRQICVDVYCECENCQYECNCQHEIDLSKHQQLQSLEYDHPVIVTRVDTSNLEIFDCSSSNHIYIVQVFDFIRTSQKLNKLSLRFLLYLDHNHSVHTAITYRLISLLSSLHELRELSLIRFALTDNIIKSPDEMKGLKLIHLNGVRMSLTTWRKFVDSLPVIQQPVTVNAYNMCIRRDGEECNPDLPRGIRGDGGGEKAAAFQYVKEQEHLFVVDPFYSSPEKKKTIKFSTGK